MTARPPSLLLTAARLIRLPNVFTATADVLLGFWIVQPKQMISFPAELPRAIVASACLYAAGMVWNDVFDVKIDRRERPDRPLPSEAVSVQFAVLFATLLSLVGLGFALSIGRESGAVAAALVVAILAYDGWLKQTAVGPLCMGICRALNVLVGATAAGYALPVDLPRFSPDTPACVIPLANGIYIAGVTWFARQEAEVSRRGHLGMAASVMGLGLALHAVVLFNYPDLNGWVWPAGALFLAAIAYRIGCAIHEPSPRRVQQAIKTLVLGLVAVDSLLVLGIVGAGHALAILLLLPPALWLGRFIYST